ncbi:uncharacterized protein NECHADRAFT_94102 [Fusarium vanettenii 77-13-4]|uniref:Saponin hydrolase n=1 Tax=Fusarium vanettenii (strain ATCC MYA-4622 / CBS 123669 / FGSC 9596 / NRRL 45880 / 77-13-4) TaxID=660122 RepID=C7ZHL3_FUSV7|nr:uncharacterized protein NECHADRAFT_94102 [Fusarium vanettenii 77-13-4]EEU36432.1 hypothetical protein NECHADRAFT_94102 [Fusarium vanettenii 77-13-4]
MANLALPSLLEHTAVHSTMKSASDLPPGPQPARGIHLHSRLKPSTTTKLVCLFVAIPPPPKPELITVSRLPLPPVAPSSDVGSCNSTINPRGTGCIAKTSGLQSGNYLPDDVHVLAVADFAGAPAAPDPASIYEGRQLIIIKTNSETFENGDAWKCITCGVSEENSRGRGKGMDYPQAFTDGKRVLTGTDIVECPDGLASEACGPENVRIIPLRWDNTADGSGPGGRMRELRLHPDNVHIGFSSLFATKHGVSQFSFFGRINYNQFPTKGEPLAPRYDVVDVSILNHERRSRAITTDPEDSTQLIINPQSLTVGELRGFSGSGNEVTWIGYPAESCNIDVFAANLADGTVRRLTSHPDYVDPVDISPDDKWTVVMDTRASERQMFLSGLRGVPPIIDLLVTAAVASVRNNGQRRFFKPWIIDQYGDRGSYIGQQLNTAGSGVPGSGDINDPEWNGRADPKWSRDGTRIVYAEAITESPACGGKNPLPCYESTEDGGRNERIMVAHLTDREPFNLPVVEPRPDVIPWGTPFPPGSSFPEREGISPGNYTLKGKVSGWADVSLGNKERGLISSISVQYHDFSDDGLNVLVGSESVSRENPKPFMEQLHWFSNLKQTGPNNGTKITSPDGFHLSIDIQYNFFHAKGNLTTTVNGKEYRQPANET